MKKFKLTDEQLAQLRSDREKHLRGETPSYTWEEVKKRARESRKKLK